MVLDSKAGVSGPADSWLKRHYGWVVAIGSGLLMFLNSQFVYTFGVLLPSLIQEFGWSRAAVSSIATMRAVTTGVLSPITGRLSDRYGSRKLILGGVVLCGLGYVLTFNATTLWQFYLALGLFMGASNAIVAVPALALVNRWFRTKAAFANGIAMAGAGLSQIVIPPLLAYLLIAHGWSSSLLGIGIVTWLVGVGTWSLMKSPPAESVAARPATGAAATGRVEYTPRQFLRTRAFWTLFVVFLITAAAFQMVCTHIVVAAMDTGATAAAAALILTVQGVANTAGRLGAGIADKFGKQKILIAAAAIQAVSLLVVAHMNSLMALYAVMGVYGLAYGSIVPNIQALGGSVFGRKAVGSVIGALATGYLAGAAIGPILGGLAFDMTGGYYVAFLAAMGALCVALGLAISFRPPRERLAVEVPSPERVAD